MIKILLTGGGTGGHFYPVIAVAEELNSLIKENKLLDVKLYYMSGSPYNEGLLYENNLIFVKNTTGKIRRYFSVQNFFDIFKTIFGSISAVWTLFKIYPDVVFGKGGYSSFPALFAARILRIPVIIHESDTVPGKVNKWAGKFAEKIAISYPQTVEFFQKRESRVAFTGNPIRKELLNPLKEGAFEFLKLEKGVPVVLVLGGSQGSQIINETIVEALPKLVDKYQILHQTGKNNLRDIENLSEVTVGNNPKKNRFKPFDYLDTEGMRMAAGAADIIVSRAGSTIFEIASWGVPSIIIPITDSNGDHQRKNAFAYARSGACVVVEEKNFNATILSSEIERITSNKEISDNMREKAKAFSKSDAARIIARELIQIALSHQK